MFPIPPMRPLLGVQPYRVSHCADFMGMTPEWVRKAITVGVAFPGDRRRRVKLDAEILPHGERRQTYRIHPGQFYVFLQAIGWKHLPRIDATIPAPVAEIHAGVQ